MNQLGTAAFARARDFVMANARPVDRGLFAFYFEQGPSGGVERALVDFQNSDGGFGHGLEPDFRLRESSAMATCVALQYLRKVDASATSPVVLGAMRYLGNTFDHERTAWQRVPAEVVEAPHAFWWGKPERPTGFEANVGAEALAYGYAYPGYFPDALLRQLEAEALKALAATTGEVEMHDAQCWARLADEPATPAAVREAVVAAMTRAVPHTVPLDPAAWTGYVLRPLQLAPSPKAALHPLVRSGIAADLDRVVADQGEDGSWSPTWEWGQHMESWPLARREWQGHLTVANLKVLADHGRLAQ